jgi:DNA replication protein DnaC
MRGMTPMSGRVTIERLAAQMESFGLKHAPRQLADIMESCEATEAGYREFLKSVLDAEVKGRNERRRRRNYAAAHFPPFVRDIAEFNCAELEGGITFGQIAQLKELTWLDSCGNLIFAGPPGLGKTMLALGLGLHAIDEGYTVAFEKMEGFVRILDGAEAERAAGFRLRYIKKASLVIVDEIGYTPITRAQANRFFNFISDTYERASIIFTTNKAIPEWAEVMGDPVLTTAMMDRILHHARCFSLRGESYRLKHPELFEYGD